MTEKHTGSCLASCERLVVACSTIGIHHQVAVAEKITGVVRSLTLLCNTSRRVENFIDDNRTLLSNPDISDIGVTDLYQPRFAHATDMPGVASALASLCVGSDEPPAGITLPPGPSLRTAARPRAWRIGASLEIAASVRVTV